MMKKRKGQGILEYVVILTAIVGAIIVVATTLMPQSVETTMGEAANTLDRAGAKWATGTTL